MRFGLHLPNFGAVGDPTTLAGLAADAEAAGWDGFFIWDHILGDPTWRAPMVDPWVSLAAIATATERIRLGALVTAVPRRRPWQLARETTTLDRLSDGRLVVGVGMGFPPEAEFEHFGEDGDRKVHARRLDEGLEILKGLWSGEPFAFEGEHYKIRETVFLPTPVQRPHPPVWVAAHLPDDRLAPRPLRRAARWDGVFPELVKGGRLTPARVTELLGYIREHRAAAGPFDVVIGGRSGDLREGQLEEYRNAGITWWLESSSPEMSLDDIRARIQRGPEQPR